MSQPPEPAIVLASASPRRRELLTAAGLAFAVAPVDVDEDLAEFGAAEQAALELARRKARAAAAAYRGSARWVLAADTVVALPAGPGRAAELLGKPADEREAARMLLSLSGSRHVVATGVAVVRCLDGWQWDAHEATEVTMRELSGAERDAYVASGEWRDKAGGYAIQESADRFVTSLVGGGFDNVVGLPVRLALDLLRRAGAPGVPELPNRPVDGGARAR